MGLQKVLHWLLMIMQILGVDLQRQRGWFDRPLINWSFLHLRTFLRKFPSIMTSCLVFISPSGISTQDLTTTHFGIALQVCLVCITQVVLSYWLSNHFPESCRSTLTKPITVHIVINAQSGTQENLINFWNSS